MKDKGREWWGALNRTAHATLRYFNDNLDSENPQGFVNFCLNLEAARAEAEEAKTTALETARVAAEKVQATAVLKIGYAYDAGVQSPVKRVRWAPE